MSWAVLGCIDESSGFSCFVRLVHNHKKQAKPVAHALATKRVFRLNLMRVLLMNNNIGNNNADDLRIVCSICIATYRRPGLLKNLLESLKNQILPENITVEVLIVDNDSEESAHPVVASCRDTDYIRFYYYTQPVKNISLTRNVALANAKGEYLLFIDDDEVADIHWLLNLYNTLLLFQADGVFGLRLPDFSTDAPKWLKHPNFYYSPLSPTGTEARFYYTGNCIVKNSLLKDHGLTFDPEYGLTGGEDTHLFGKLRRIGGKLVTCREAIIYEFIPPERARLSYVLRKAMRGGNTYARRLLEDRQRFFYNWFYLFFKSTGIFFASFIMFIAFLPVNLQNALLWMKRGAASIGQLLAGLSIHYREYN